MVFCKRCYFMANYFNLGCSSALSRMVNRVSAFRGAARPCGVPSKQVGFVKKPVSPDLVTRFGLLKPMWQKTSKSRNQQSSWNWVSNTHWLKAKMQIVNLCCWGFFSAFALLFGNCHHLYYLWAVSKNIFRTCLLLRWGCTRLLLNRNKSLLFLCRFFVNLSSTKLKVATAWASFTCRWNCSEAESAQGLAQATGRFSRVLYLPALHVMYGLFWLCCVFTLVFFAILFHFISAMPYHFSPHWFQNNASAERRGG